MSIADACIEIEKESRFRASDQTYWRTGRRKPKTHEHGGGTAANGRAQLGRAASKALAPGGSATNRADVASGPAGESAPVHLEGQVKSKPGNDDNRDDDGHHGHGETRGVDWRVKHRTCALWRQGPRRVPLGHTVTLRVHQRSTPA